MPTKYKVLITGSSGMLGVDLSCELKKDYEVVGTDLIQNNLSAVTAFHKCDIVDCKSIKAVVGKARPDIIVHAAAWTDVDGCELDKDKAYKVNSEGTRNIAMACKDLEVVLFYISTDFIFDGKKKTPYKEIDMPNPISIYGDSKLKGEHYVGELLKKYFIIRTSWLYGKNGKNFVDTIMAKSKKEKMLRVVNDQVGAPTHTKDLAKAIHVMLDKIFKSQGRRVTGSQVGTYHVSNSGSVSWYDYAKEILKLAKSDTKVEPISSAESSRPARRPAMSVLDNSKFVKFTGYKMRNWKDAVKEYIFEGKGR